MMRLRKWQRGTMLLLLACVPLSSLSMAVYQKKVWPELHPYQKYPAYSSLMGVPPYVAPVRPKYVDHNCSPGRELCL